MLAFIKYNAKLILSHNAATAFVLAIMAPLFFRFSNMQFENLAKMGELYLSLTGPLLFTYLGRFEENANSWELIYVKRTSYLKLQLGRTISLLFFNALVILLPLSAAYISSEALEFGEGFWGIVISAWFLGLLGMVTVEIFGSQKVGYIIALGYYFFETSTKGRFNVAFQVFGYVWGNFHSKKYVLMLCIILIAIQMITIKRRAVCKLFLH